MYYIVESRDTFDKGQEPWYFGSVIVDEVEADRPFSAEEFICARRAFGRPLGTEEVEACDSKITVKHCCEDGSWVTDSQTFLSTVHEKHGWGEVEHSHRVFRPRVRPGDFGDAKWCVPNWWTRRVSWADIHAAQAEREAERQSWHSFFTKFLADTE